ncbi:hypothetical protein MLD38_010878 [Melastoma candidum]|uniref:Uncharacterized protein n=1 Tax=Melastoma candidum TaxID=119954 RepID=A0ACB9R2J9_9MYRT|nr:hypothetical protein MLD38_010878 [Melastoma candidum]
MAILGFPLVISFLKPHSLSSSRPFVLIRCSSASSSSYYRSLRHRGVSSLAATGASSCSVRGAEEERTELRKKSKAPTFQQAIQLLQEYWASVGCRIMQCSNTEVGAGTMNPATYLRVLGPEPWNVAYVEPSIRPDDSRYGENPNRLQRHTQFQVILKPDPGNSQDLFVRSLTALGIDVTQHDIRFVEDNWESPVLGAWGLGWEVWMDGMEITQFTYFQQAGSLPLMPVSVEITYGLERILMLLQGVDHFKKIEYADGITYGELFLENEKEMSAYYLEHANVHRFQKLFELFEEESRSLLALGLAIPAYDQLLKTSHTFNILDSRGFVGVTERARYFGRMRSLARQCAQLWLKTRESLNHPLGIVDQPTNLVYPKEILEEMAKKEQSSVPRVFVLEIGTEEMPPHDVVSACEQLKVLITNLLESKRLSHGNVQVFGTPRRIVTYIESLSPRQTEIEVEVRGPPASKAFDAQGNPTKAVEGFCRRYSIGMDSTFRKSDGKTEYVFAHVKEPAGLALEVLSKDLPNTLGNITFSKSMRWNSEVTFSRPIRWILAVHGDQIVPFAYAGLLSGNLSYGLRNTPLATLMVENAESYLGLMNTVGVELYIEGRKKRISQMSNALAETVNGHVIVNEGLLDEVVNLVEAPVPVLGKFNDSFLSLPGDLLTMVMQKHQKYFAITDDNGKLLPYFIAVGNGIINEVVVREGNEAVLRARYEDAKFFYEVDARKKLSEFRSQLKGILFHEKLGTMLDKAMRLENMVGKVGLAMGLDDHKMNFVQEAASLAMSDLATSVVTEFTSLAGIMGRHYARRDGYSDETAEALFEITLPRYSGDVVPQTDIGMVLSVTDRLDSLVGLFAAGCQPSSTNDPFGLRRISYGLVQVLVEKNNNLNLQHALEIAAEFQPVKVEQQMISEVHQFVTRRLEQFLVDKEVGPEIVRAVLLERSNVPSLAAKSAVEMEVLSRGELLRKIVEAYSRPTRIVRGKDFDSSVEVDEAAFQTDQERALWDAFLTVKSQITTDIAVGSFVESSQLLLKPLDDFFNNVFVMVDDERTRLNRLALLKRVADLPRGIVDLSVLPGF